MVGRGGGCGVTHAPETSISPSSSHPGVEGIDLLLLLRCDDCIDCDVTVGIYALPASGLQALVDDVADALCPEIVWGLSR